MIPERFIERTALWGALIAMATAWAVNAEQPASTEQPPEILSIGGEVTEIVYALGQGHRLLARDTTSTWPEAARALPDVGYMRALSPEGVLSVGPDLILAAEGSGPPEALEVLREAQVNFVEVAHGFDGEAIATKIRTVGEALGTPSEAEALVREVSAALDTALTKAEAYTGPRKRVLFVLTAEGGKLTVGGAETAADALIRMAGGVNAADSVAGFKPMSSEAVIAAAPDVILMMNRGGNHSLSPEELFAIPALALTPAARARALIRVDGLRALRFGPRTAHAVSDLNTALYGE